MKSQVQPGTGRYGKLLLTLFTAAGIGTGWFLGSISTHVNAQSERKRAAGKDHSTFHVSPVTMNGESLPTIILSECTVIPD